MVTPSRSRRDLAAALQRHPAWLKAEALRCGRGEAEWLFLNDDGQPMDESRVRKEFKRALAHAKLRAFRVYDLRHTYASLLLAAGATITYVSAQLGTLEPERRIGHSRRSGSARLCWWAVKDSNLGPAD